MVGGMHRKIVSRFLKHDRENSFLQQRQKPLWLLQSMEKQFVLGNSAESGWSCCASELAGYEMETAAAQRCTGQKCLLCPIARNLLCWSWAPKYPEEPLPHQPSAQSTGTPGLHCLWGYNRPWLIYWWIQRQSQKFAQKISKRITSKPRRASPVLLWIKT